MDNKILEIFIPGPAGRLEAKYYKKINILSRSCDKPNFFLRMIISNNYG